MTIPTATIPYSPCHSIKMEDVWPLVPGVGFVYAMFIHTKRHFADIWVVVGAAAMGVMLLREVRSSVSLSFCRSCECTVITLWHYCFNLFDTTILSLSILAGIAHIEMLYRTNLLALTGHSNSPMYPPNKVFVYDDHLQRPIGELSFRQKVLTTKLRRDRIVIVLRDRVYIYNFSDLVGVYNCEARFTNIYGATSSNPRCCTSLFIYRLY